MLTTIREFILNAYSWVISFIVKTIAVLLTFGIHPILGFFTFCVVLGANLNDFK